MYRAMHGRKWAVFSSQKQCHVCFAIIQAITWASSSSICRRSSSIRSSLSLSLDFARCLYFGSRFARFCCSSLLGCRASSSYFDLIHGLEQLSVSLCGKRLAFYVTKKLGKNHGRAYVKCLDDICGFYSFVDELKMCPCNQGYCRTVFKSSNKYWVCAMQGNMGACRFKELIVTFPAPGTSTAPLTTTPPATSTTPTKNELILKSLELSQDYITALNNIVRDFADLPIADDCSSSSSKGSSSKGKQ